MGGLGVTHATGAAGLEPLKAVGDGMEGTCSAPGQPILPL